MNSFDKVIDIFALLEYTSCDYKISLILEMLSKIGPIYLLFYIKLKTLRKCLDENFKKNFIRLKKIY